MYKKLLCCAGMIIGLTMMACAATDLYYRKSKKKSIDNWNKLYNQFRDIADRDNKIYEEIINHELCPEDLKYSCKRLMGLNNELLDLMSVGPLKADIYKINLIKKDYDNECEIFKELKESYMKILLQQLAELNNEGGE